MAAPFFDPWLFNAPFIRRRPAATPLAAFDRFAHASSTGPHRVLSSGTADPARPGEPAASRVNDPWARASDRLDHRLERPGESHWSEFAFVGLCATAFLLTAGCAAYVLAASFM